METKPFCDWTLDGQPQRSLLLLTHKHNKLSPARRPRNLTAPLLSLLLGRHKPYITTCCHTGSVQDFRLPEIPRFTLFWRQTNKLPKYNGGNHITKCSGARRCSYKTKLIKIMLPNFLASDYKDTRKSCTGMKLSPGVCDGFPATKRFLVKLFPYPFIA